MVKLLDKVERVIILVLTGLMVIVVALATLDLGWLIVQDIITPPFVLLDIEELLDIFGFFLLVLIGVELLSTLTEYLKNHQVRAEVVVEVAVIAIARKVIILDLKENPSLTLVGIAAIIVSLAAAIFALKRWRSAGGSAGPKEGSSPRG